MIETITDFFVGSFLGLLVWFFGGLDGLMTVLIAFVVIDYITGMLAAGKNHEIDSSIGFWGIARKCMIFIFVGMAHLIDNSLANYLPDFTHGSGAMRPIITLFYILNEGTSIIENADRLNVPIPSPLHSLLAKLHKMTEQQPEHKQENKEPQKLPEGEIMPFPHLGNDNEHKQEDSQEDSEDKNINNDNKENEK